MESLCRTYQYFSGTEKTAQMKFYIPKYHFIEIISLVLLLSACEANYDSFSCSDCYDEKPTIGLISVSVSISNENDSIPIRILKGTLENDNVYLLDTLTKDFEEFWVKVGHFYTVEATYKSEGKTILAVDGDKVTVYLDDSNCDVSCWRANDGKADCTLK